MAAVRAAPGAPEAHPGAGPVETTIGSRGPALEIQRARLLHAMAQVARERGFAGASVGAVSARAGVSRRTFHELFDGLEECFVAVLDEGGARVSAVLAGAFAAERSWLDGTRDALAGLLAFFDSEPALAHVLLVEATAAGPWARERRERHVAALTELIEGRWGAPAGGQAHPLATAGVVASLLGVLHTHLVTGRPEPALALLGPLMGLVTAPYLDQRGVAREIARGEALAAELLAAGVRERARPAAGALEIPDLLLDPRAHRARACLLYLAERPGASNRQVARAVGVARDAHISTLLARLRGMGLVVKRAGRPGGPNAWSPSAYGLRVAHALAPRPGGLTSGT